MIIDKIKRLLRSGYRQIKKFWQIGFVVTLALCISFICSFSFKSYARYSSSINVEVSAEAGALNMGCTVTTTTDTSNGYPYFIITVTNTDEDLIQSDVSIYYTLTISQTADGTEYVEDGVTYNYKNVSGVSLSYKDGYGNGAGTVSSDDFEAEPLTYSDTITLGSLQSDVTSSEGYYENVINIYVYYPTTTSTNVHFDVYLDAHQVTDTNYS